MRGLVLGCLLLSLSCDAPRAAQLPRFGAVPPFRLIDQRGAPVSNQSFAGKVLIADFVFTSCPDVCPLLTQKLVAIRGRLPRGRSLVFVSFSVDPEHDTPERLRAFAASQRAQGPDWYFLTGPLHVVKQVVTRGFKQAMERQPSEPGKPRNVLHGSHFVLVDAQGTIRGFYASDQNGADALVADTLALLPARERP